ncbi:hypothetical protein FHL15_004258 [Xylaria flabelliformis]|uniref:Uncharacterized protein n=1 Tax=Xylaria flabelliformis TaxID=2512241 RepID=A0A553I3L8_9PEZI|nr:hypothetical protein FHL15_004258 [Xylaria flabelliformis]
MASDSQNFRKIAEEAERNLNTYEAKTGAHKSSTNDEAGIDTRVENQFPGSQVRSKIEPRGLQCSQGSCFGWQQLTPSVTDGQDLSTNAGYNRRIPPEEGGDLDARGRQTRGEHFEGVGGPEHKLSEQMRDFGGSNEFDLTNKRRHDTSARSTADDTTESYSGEVMSEGRKAAQSNIESSKSVPHKGQYPGSEYRTTQEVPGEMSAEGYEAPASVTEASRESERYNR